MSGSEKPKFNLEALRKKLEHLRGRSFWKGLEEIAGTDEFRGYLEHEYPQGAGNFENPVSRREFLKIMAASLFMATLAGCNRSPVEKMIAYLSKPEEITPGQTLFFATGMPWNGSTTGLLAASHMGRPTKLEGNPAHPDSLGSTNAPQQAALLGLYDPERSKAVIKNGQISTWDAFSADMRKELQKYKKTQGSGLRFLTQGFTSPTMGRQMDAILKEFPQARWHIYDAVNHDSARKAQKMVFGKFVDPLYDFDQADVIVSLESDFLTDLSASLRYTRRFTARRKAGHDQNKINRLYVFEAAPSVTGSMADHRIAVKSADIRLLARQLAKALTIDTPQQAHRTNKFSGGTWASVLAEDLKANKGRSLVLAGTGQPPEVHALAYAINEVLGNTNRTVRYIKPAEYRPVIKTDSINDLVSDIKKGQVDMLVIASTNPLYNAPADFQFNEHLSKINRIVHFGSYENETSAYCHWHIPEAHFLEIFSDGRASDGTVTMIQPLIAPLFGGKSPHEFLAVFSGEQGLSNLEIVRKSWQQKLGAVTLFDSKWRKAVHDGYIAETSFESELVRTRTAFDQKTWESLTGDPELKNTDLEIVFRPDPSIWDGEFVNNAWLQELPKPFTKLTWDNAAWISPKTAQSSGLDQGDFIEIHNQDQTITVPVWIMPGQADGSITLFLGYGRNMKTKLSEGLGFNVFPLRRSASPWIIQGASIRKTGKRYRFASTQVHHSMEGRDFIRTATLDEYLKNPGFAQSHEALPSIYPPHEYPGHAWGMAIDLNACIGCNACTIACQAENNIPVVGKDQVIAGREMHWIRIDQYYEGKLDKPRVHSQPVLCMHCENAPCEPVCPVGATVHSSEGLNEMVYNRCVGTRYCSNNCPYKVRRFNFLEYNGSTAESLKLMHNPEVTVRTRGVMEKCSFCVQRIQQSKITAEKENRTLKDGEIITACQSACPAQAITFGDINDKHSAVARLKKLPLNYGILTELNTRPRVTYLAKILNPNPAAPKEDR